MVERCGESSRLDMSSAEKPETSDETRSETGAILDLQVTSSPAAEATDQSASIVSDDGRAEGVEQQSVSCRSRLDHEETNPDHPAEPDPPFTTEDVTPAGKQAAGDSLRPAGTLGRGDPDVQDHHGGETLLHKHELDSLTERREEEDAYQAVLHQMLQLQKHKPGRRFKRKTLIKMAKLFVIAKGLDKKTGSAEGLEAFTSAQTPAEAAFSCQTEAPATFKDKSRKETEKQEKDWNISENLPEPLHKESSPETASEEQKFSEISSVSVGEETKVTSGVKGKKKTSKQKKRAAQTPEDGVKKPSEETSAGHNETRWDGNGEDPTENRETVMKVKKKRGRPKKEKLKNPPQAAAEAISQSEESSLAPADQGVSAQHGDQINEQITGENISKPWRKRTTGSKYKKCGHAAHQIQTGGEEREDEFPPAAAAHLKTPRKPPPKAPVVKARLSPEAMEFETRAGRKKSTTPKRRGRKAVQVREEKQERTITSVNGGKPKRGRGGRRRLKDKAVEESLSLTFKTEPAWEAAADQLDVPPFPTDLPTESQASGKKKARKRSKKTSEQDMKSSASSVWGSLKWKGRRKKRKPENGDTLVENPQNNETDEGSKHKKIRRKGASVSVAAEHVTSEPDEYLTRCSKGSGKGNIPPDRQQPEDIWNSEAANPENTTKAKERKNRWSVRGRRTPAAGVEPYVDHITAASLAGNAKEKRKRANKKLTSHVASALDVKPEGVMVGRKKRGRKPKRELNKDGFPSSGRQPEAGPEIPETGPTAGESQRETSDLKDVLMLSVEVDCEATTSDLKKKKQLESDEQLTRPSEGEGINKPSNFRRRRKRGGASNTTDLKAVKQEPDDNKTPGIRFFFQAESTKEESSISTKPTKKKRRRRSRTHWTGNKKAKPFRISLLWNNQAGVETLNSGLKEETIRMTDQDATVTKSRSISCNRPETQKSQKKTLQCSFCGRSFRHISAFTLHKRIHTGEKPYRCPTCGKSLAKLSQLKLHTKLHAAPPAARCPCCRGAFKTKTQLILHFRSHLKDSLEMQTGSEGESSHENTFRCSVCTKEFTNRSVFKTHRKPHRKPHSCSICRKTFRKPSSLSLHQKSHQPVQELQIHSETPFTCCRCDEAFCSSAPLRHQASVCSDGTPAGMDQFLVARSTDAVTATPLFFKCPLCEQRHRHWCHYVLHLQTHTGGGRERCEACRQRYDQAAEARQHCSLCCKDSGEEKACRASLKDVWKEAGAGNNIEENKGLEAEQKGETSASPQVIHVQSPPPSTRSSSPSVMDDFDVSAPSPSPQVSRFLQAIPPRLSSRFLCGRCGKSFTRWNKMWLHQRLHRKAGRSFHCSRCQLEFHFLGSYVHHLQEHAAQTPHACPSCPDSFAHQDDLSSHISVCHQQQDSLKCSTCGKRFSTLTNLQKHQLLHKGAKSHVCLPCNLRFSCYTALTAHIKTHRRRLGVPQPAPVLEPLLFPYPCRECNATFSSAELLQAHQVCHVTAGKKPESPQEGATFRNLERPPQDVASEPSQPARRLPVSNKKHLFRYPHPDRLYVVPTVSSETPVVVSDAEEENPDVAPREPAAGLNSSDPEQKAGGSDPLDRIIQSLIPEECPDTTDGGDREGDAAEPQGDHVHACVMCTATFTDVTRLREHYIYHTRRT